MSFRATSCLAGFVFVLLIADPSAGQDPASKPAARPAASGPGELFGLGNMAQAASDLRQAGEAFERFGDAVGGISETIATALATMSSEFDPFGYKTAFRTIGQQAEIIQQQSQMIRDLQQREIERLQHENQQLIKQLKKRRKPKRR